MSNIHKRFKDKEYWNLKTHNNPANPPFEFTFDFRDDFSCGNSGNPVNAIGAGTTPIRMETSIASSTGINVLDVGNTSVSFQQVTDGTNDIKVWLRELSNLTSITFNPLPQLAFFSLGDIGVPFDLSKFTYLKHFEATFNVFVGGEIAFPTSILTECPLYLKLTSCRGINAPILDLSNFTAGIDTIYLVNPNYLNPISPDLTRVILPTNNAPDGLAEFHFHAQQLGHGLQALGPSAGTGTAIDLSLLKIKNSASFYISNNGLNYDTFTLPTIPVGNWVYFYLNESDCTTLDFSTITFATNAEFRTTTHNLLTTWIPPSAIEAAKVSKFAYDHQPLITTFDASRFTNAHETLAISYNITLTSITLPTTTGVTIDSFQINDNNVLGYVNTTVMSNFLDKNDCKAQFESCNWSAAIVNQVLVDLDNNTSGGYTGRIIWIDGSIYPNAAPDGSSGGVNGLIAKANLITKGFTVNTN